MSMILFKSVRMHLFVILDYLVHSIKQEKPEDSVSWEFQLAWHSDFISCHICVMERTQNHNDYASLGLSEGARQIPWTATVPCTFPRISTKTKHFSFCPMPLPRNLSASFLSKAGDTSFEYLHLSRQKTLGSDAGQCCRAGLWQMHTLFPAFYYPLRSLGVVNFLLVSAQLT